MAALQILALACFAAQASAAEWQPAQHGGRSAVRGEQQHGDLKWISRERGPLQESSRSPASKRRKPLSQAAYVPSDEEAASWQPDDLVWPASSGHKCVGTDLKTRSCHFQNLVYDRRKKKFEYYKSSPDEDTELLQKLPYYENFGLRIMDGPFPERNHSCDELEPVYLTNALRPYSFGHTVRDFFTITTANLHELGLMNTTYKVAIIDILPYIGKKPDGDARGVRLLHRYMEWVGEGAIWFGDLAMSCHKMRYVVFRDIVAGSLLFNMPSEMTVILPKLWGGCDSPIFELHRDKAYRLARLGSVVPASRHEEIKVLFGDKPQRDSRRIVNIAELIPALKQRFPRVRFVSKVLQHLTAREQLEEMSSTTIFISPHASSSFRMAYLPSDAHAIIVGPPEMDGHTAGDSFIEIDECWGHMTYFTVGRYHITERNEWIVRFDRGYQPDNKKITEFFQWFDSDSRLSPQKLGDLIQEGLHMIRSKALKTQ